VGYIEKNLVTGESVIYRTRLHWTCLVRLTLLALLLEAIAGWLIYWMVAPGRSHDSDWLWWVIAALIIAGIAIFAAGVISRRAAEFAVTNKRVILKAGVLHQRTQELFLNKVESVGVDQSLWGRICGYGSITVHGTGGSAEPFHRIARPLEFRHQVQEQIGRITPSAGGT
jgi:uncharacterized membrane protein YdbT with pleckstrin-like domain